MPHFDHFPRPGESDPYMLMIKPPPPPVVLTSLLGEKAGLARGLGFAAKIRCYSFSDSRWPKKQLMLLTIEGQTTNCTTDRHFNPLDDFAMKTKTYDNV